MSQTIGVRLTDTYTAAELAAAGFRAGQVFTNYDGKVYKLYKFNNGAGNVAAVAGNVAYFYAVSGTSAGQTTEVTMDLTDTQEVGAGVFQAVIADGSFGWFQIKGPATLTTALTAGADGDPLTPTGATDGTLDVIVATEATSAICAFAIDADAKIVMCDFPY